MRTPLCIVKAKVFIDESGNPLELPALLTPEGVLGPLIDYLVGQALLKSMSWKKDTVRAVRRYLGYAQANPDFSDPIERFAGFAIRLQTGTFGTEGLDHSGLCWQPISANRSRLLVRLLSNFFDWLAPFEPGIGANPFREGTSSDRALAQAAYEYRRNRAFLGHTWEVDWQPASTNGGIRSIQTSRPIATFGSPPAFPDRSFFDLLVRGFERPRGHDLRGILISLLLHGAGFRESEVFHMFISDVLEDPSKPNSALVLIQHPSEGSAPYDWVDVKGEQIKGNRAAYLATHWGTAPRSRTNGQRHAGWKGGRHESEYGGRYFRAYWFLEEYGVWFWHIWNMYLRQIAFLPRDHPYALVNMSRGVVGQPYNIKVFNKAHARAVRRIGLVPEKALGTTPHGHRHAYAKRLQSAEVPDFITQRCLKHLSPESQAAYKQPTIGEVVSELSKAAARLVAPHATTTTDRLMAEVRQ